MVEAAESSKERVHIVYKAATGSGTEDKELPLKLLMMGDFTGSPDATPLDRRRPIAVTRDNFDEVLASHRIRVDVAVPDELGDKPGATLAASLRFAALGDFAPEAIVRQVPEMARLLALREALTALKGPLGAIPEFRARIAELVGDEQARAALLGELGVRPAP